MEAINPGSGRKENGSYKTGKERNQRAESCFWETKTAKTCKGKGCKRKTAERIQRAKRETSQRKDD
mgnify:CR=1 FL=1